MLLGEEAEAEELDGSEEEQSSTVCPQSLHPLLMWDGAVTPRLLLEFLRMILQFVM